MSDPNPAITSTTPVDGKFIFQIDEGVRIRFNADGWVEEIGRGGPEDPLGTTLQGKPSSKRDDIFARRFYDLYARIVLFDIHPKTETSRAGTGGLLKFTDLEKDSKLYERVNKIIAIANHNFKLGVPALNKEQHLT